MENQLDDKEKIINSQIKIINEQKEKLSKMEEQNNISSTYDDDFEDNDY